MTTISTAVGDVMQKFGVKPSTGQSPFQTTLAPDNEQAEVYKNILKLSNGVDDKDELKTGIERYMYAIETFYKDAMKYCDTGASADLEKKYAEQLTTVGKLSAWLDEDAA